MKNFVVFEGYLSGAIAPISVVEFQNGKAAKEVLTVAFEIEKNFALLARAYIDFEKSLMSAALEWSMEDTDLTSHSDYFDEWSEVINLKLIALLSVGGVYTEKMEGIAKRETIPGFDPSSYEPYRTNIFDTNIHYRFMCALRNYSIHAQVPIKGFPVEVRFEYEDGKPSTDGESRARYTCNPYIEIAPLVADKKVRAKTRKEIQDLGVGGLDLKMLVRGYIEGLFALHSTIRQQTEKAVSDALSLLEGLEARLSQAKGDQCKHAYIGEQNTGFDSALYISKHRLSRIERKRLDWMKLKSLRNRFVSNEAIKRPEISLGDVGGIWIRK